MYALGKCLFMELSKFQSGAIGITPHYLEECTSFFFQSINFLNNLDFCIRCFISAKSGNGAKE